MKWEDNFAKASMAAILVCRCGSTAIDQNAVGGEHLECYTCGNWMFIDFTKMTVARVSKDQDSLGEIWKEDLKISKHFGYVERTAQE